MIYSLIKQLFLPIEKNPIIERQNNMKKLFQLFKEGMVMLSNSTYGDINCLHKNEKQGQDLIKINKKHKKKSVRSRSHLNLIK